ncbi:hypothetical protein SAMN04487884_1394 [Butyrivibrio fibrisolvens]|uniref:Uncharacterized protein n=1 Tax=Butyrivibrio fibrisolvens TaxID=831 RepID=A0A1H9X0P2_BUTFI|nr:hypothetical protein SAMN04487884_1394 [Butyrivibrio fibrisolvens]
MNQDNTELLHKAIVNDILGYEVSSARVKYFIQIRCTASDSFQEGRFAERLSYYFPMPCSFKTASLSFISNILLRHDLLRYSLQDSIHLSLFGSHNLLILQIIRLCMLSYKHAPPDNHRHTDHLQL